MWRADGRGFCIIDGPRDRTTILDIDPGTGAAQPLLDVDRLRKAVEGVVDAPLPWAGLPFREFRFADDDQRIEFKCCERRSWRR